MGLLKRLSSYHLGVGLSTASLGLGIFREFLIVGLLGFSGQNDLLQIYLSVFYTIGLTIDAMRLSCLNLYGHLSLGQMLVAATVVSLPFAVVIGMVMQVAAHGMAPWVLMVAILGGYLNLMVALLMTYRQRQDRFLAAQVVSVLPNLVLIPGVLGLYWFLRGDFVVGVVMLTGLIPVVQGAVLLWGVRGNSGGRSPASLRSAGLRPSIWVFIRHFASTLGEQLLQIILRAAFFNFGTGFLSLFAIAIRIYSALRFILIDSYIGSKLGKHQTHAATHPLVKLTNAVTIGLLIAIATLALSFSPLTTLSHTSLLLIALLSIGFYFSTLMRIIYFKINDLQMNTAVVMRFAGFEFLFAALAFAATKTLADPLLTLIWIAYIARPFCQLLILRKRFNTLHLQTGALPA